MAKLTSLLGNTSKGKIPNQKLGGRAYLRNKVSPLPIPDVGKKVPVPGRVSLGSIPKGKFKGV